MRVALVVLSLGGVVCASFFCMGFLGRVIVEFARDSATELRIILFWIWGMVGAIVCGTVGVVAWFKVRNRKTIDMDLVAVFLGTTLGWLLTVGLVLRATR